MYCSENYCKYDENKLFYIIFSESLRVYVNLKMNIFFVTIQKWKLCSNYLGYEYIFKMIGSNNSKFMLLCHKSGLYSVDIDTDNVWDYVARVMDFDSD